MSNRDLGEVIDLSEWVTVEYADPEHCPDCRAPNENYGNLNDEASSKTEGITMQNTANFFKPIDSHHPLWIAPLPDSAKDTLNVESTAIKPPAVTRTRTTSNSRIEPFVRSTNTSFNVTSLNTNKARNSGVKTDDNVTAANKPSKTVNITTMDGEFTVTSLGSDEDEEPSYTNTEKYPVLAKYMMAANTAVVPPSPFIQQNEYQQLREQQQRQIHGWNPSELAEFAGLPLDLTKPHGSKPTTNSAGGVVEMDSHADSVQMNRSPGSQLVSTTTQQQQQHPSTHEDQLVSCTNEGCTRQFLTNSGMRRHLRWHELRTHYCGECGRSFLKYSHLERHFRMHTGEKPFQCNVEGCGKRFSLDFHLRSHERLHDADRLNVCPVKGCNKRYVQEAKLWTHLSKHFNQNANENNNCDLK